SGHGICRDPAIAANSHCISQFMVQRRAQGGRGRPPCRAGDYRSICRLPLNVFTRRRLPEPPPPSSAFTTLRLLLGIGRATAESSRPLNELNVTSPRASAGTRSSTLPLNVSTSIVRESLQRASWISTDPLKVCA